MTDDRRLTRAFYARETVTVARELLGKVLVHVAADGIERAGTIVETEAYVGPDDQASHARVGRRGRAALMYGQAGVAYVYFIYGMHYCFNAVTERDDYPGAVLVRAVEPVNLPERGNGPALVCRALHIDRACNGLDLVQSDLYIRDAASVADERVRVGSRVGVQYAGEWSDKPWRFWIADSPHVSRTRKTGSVFEAAMLR